MKKISILAAIFVAIAINSYSQDPSRFFNVQFISSNNNEQNTDIIGQWHNDALDYTYDKLSKEISLDQTTFTISFNKHLNDYFKNKGLNVDLKFDGNYEEFSKESIEENICNSINGLSEEAKTVICKIQKNLNDYIYEKITTDEFMTAAEQLRVSSESLKIKGERKICGVAASVSSHSISYWSSNYSKYITTFSTHAFNDQSGINSNKGGPNMNIYSAPVDLKFLKLRWGFIGLSDLAGAVRWGIVGFTAAGGPAGAIACGIAGAAGHSCASIIGQAIINR